MLRLPILNYRLVESCNFAAAHILLGVIAGVSTTLYSQTGSKGDCFRKVLVNYYPFPLEPGNTISPEDAARTLWSVFRNPLAHDLGVDLEKKAKTPAVKIMRILTNNKTRDLPEKSVEALEQAFLRPALLNKPTLVIRSDATVLFVEPFYWGVRRMLEDLMADTKRIQAAENFLSKI